MSAYAMKHFDLLNFVKKSKELGVSEPLAEYQGRQIEEAIEVAIAESQKAVEARELATKKDIKELELKIEQSKNHLIFWLVGLFLTSGVIMHLLH
jgi:hypothetical protein